MTDPNDTDCEEVVDILPLTLKLGQLFKAHLIVIIVIEGEGIVLILRIRSTQIVWRFSNSLQVFCGLLSSQVSFYLLIFLDFRV